MHIKSPDKNSRDVASFRRRAKVRLVEAHGGRCTDCRGVFPPYMYDFDHRDPSTKLFAISNNGNTIAYARLLEESMKCDMVCANCHRIRTHKQRCGGCELCEQLVIAP